VHRLFELFPDQPNAGIPTLCLHHTPHQGRRAAGLLAVPARSHGQDAPAGLHIDHHPDAPSAGLPAQRVPQRNRA